MRELGDWWRHYSPMMEHELNYRDRPGDKNLNMHLPSESSSGTRPGRRPLCPPWLAADPRRVAAIVEYAEIAMGKVNQEVPDQSDSAALEAAWRKHFGEASDKAGVSTDVLMRLWSGCLAAAKALSPTNYWIGPVGFHYRYSIWRNQIFPTCKADDVYRAGALAAPFFKLFRRERITLNGVPLRTCDDPSFVAWGKIKEFER